MAELLKVLTQALYLLMRGSVLQNNNRLVSVILATTAPRIRGLLEASLRLSKWWKILIPNIEKSYLAKTNSHMVRT